MGTPFGQAEAGSTAEVLGPPTEIHVSDSPDSLKSSQRTQVNDSYKYLAVRNPITVLVVPLYSAGMATITIPALPYSGNRHYSAHCHTV